MMTIWILLWVFPFHPPHSQEGECKANKASETYFKNDSNKTKSSD